MGSLDRCHIPWQGNIKSTLKDDGEGYVNKRSVRWTRKSIK